ncbi:hypothetical protein SESBI_00155 [Sesbania bispinosa]|nr:hypothetical protein SESBI_00155 [Sesbania bispinosa]
MNLSAALSSSLAASSLSATNLRRRNTCFPSNTKIHAIPFSFRDDHHQHRSFILRVANDADRTEVSSDTKTGTASSYSDADKIVDAMDFGELCNEFECISSPLDPIRSFTGREKYKRPLWATSALDNPSVTVQEMVMLSTSVLSIKWTMRGKPKSFLAGFGGDLILRITSKFTLNQISGQVIQHEEFWDLSASSASAQTFFWTSRALFATVESVKDLADNAKNLSSNFSTKQENSEFYPDPSGDPTKFFETDDSFQQDVYQIALLLAVLYFVVQFLRTVL